MLEIGLIVDGKYKMKNMMLHFRYRIQKLCGLPC